MNITSGKIASAQKVTLYGPEGIGKSQLASMFPGALFIDVEGSTKHMDVHRLDVPSSWAMLMEEVAWVAKNPDACRTLVIDTADWAETLCIAHICSRDQKAGIEDYGYGKGYTYLAEEFGRLLDALGVVVDHGVNVVMTAHAQIKKFEQPDEMAAYDRWELKLGKKTAPLLKEWSDMVLFANYKTFAVKDAKTSKVTGQGGKRVLYTQHTPAWDAKNRHDLPAEIPFDGCKELPAELATAIPSEVKPVVGITKQSAQGAPPAEPTKVASDPAVAEAIIKHLEPVEVVQEPARVKLAQLMETAGVDEAEIRGVVAKKGYFPIATPITTYPLDFVEGVLVAAWPQVLSGVNEARQIPISGEIAF